MASRALLLATGHAYVQDCSAVATTAQFRMADRLAGGKLAEALARLKAEDRSYEDIGRQLYADHGIEVSRPTLAKWCSELGIEDKAGAA